MSDRGDSAAVGGANDERETDGDPIGDPEAA